MASKRATQKLSVGKSKASIKRPRPDTVVRKKLPEALPTSVQKSYFMLGDKERDVLNQALEEYRPGRSEPILIVSVLLSARLTASQDFDGQLRTAQAVGVSFSDSIDGKVGQPRKYRAQIVANW